MTTIRSALEEGTRSLSRAHVPGARLDAQVLLREVLQVEPVTLYAHPERELTRLEEQRYSAWIEERGKGKPVAYITGHKEFYGLDFVVDPRVLIPRPETELLVEKALQAIHACFDSGRAPIVADIGTGSGAIPVTLAVEEPRLPYLYAVDISEEALAVARLNCRRHGVEGRVRLLQGDLLAALPEPVDVLTANLPYVGTSEAETLAQDVIGYEPHLALFSGSEGLNLLTRFLQEASASQNLEEGSVLLLEIGYRQKEALTRLVKALWDGVQIDFFKDYAGWDRLMQIVL